jgi:glycolate oxidase iron-sulfur subunit
MSIYDPTIGQQVFDPRLPGYDELQGCIRCGRCLPVCPTYGETQLEMYSPRGRLSLLRAVEDGKLELTSGVEAHLYHCLDCRACNTVCPPGVRIGELIVRGRVAVEEQHPRPRWIKFGLRSCLGRRAGHSFFGLTGWEWARWVGRRGSARNCGN